MNKKIVFSIAAFSFFSLVIISCGEDETISKPVITIEELGVDNSHIGTRGEEFHVEAEVTAEGRIASIEIIIHQEEEGEDEKSTKADEAWEYDSIYTEGFIGFKNATFHQHIEVPSDILTGEYHFHFIVNDQDGYQTMVEEEIEIQSSGE